MAASLCDLFQWRRRDVAASACRRYGSAWRLICARTGATCPTLRGVLSGGSAVPPSLIAAFEARGHRHGAGWGMTEMSPLGTVSALKAKHAGLDAEGKR